MTPDSWKNAAFFFGIAAPPICVAAWTLPWIPISVKPSVAIVSYAPMGTACRLRVRKEPA